MLATEASTFPKNCGDPVPFGPLMGTFDAQPLGDDVCEGSVTAGVPGPITTDARDHAPLFPLCHDPSGKLTAINLPGNAGAGGVVETADGTLWFATGATMYRCTPADP